MRVLVCPASSHYFTDKAGSMYSIPYNLLPSLSKFEIRLYPIVNNIDPLTKVPQNLIRLGSPVKFGHKVNKWNDITFLFKSLKYAKRVIRDEDIDIIHHMTPFVYGSSFNLLNETNSYPFVIGPAEYPHLFLYDDYIYLRGKANIITNVEYPIVKWLHKKLTNPLFLKTIDRCNILIAVNKRTKKEYSKVMSGKKIRVIPLGVDLDKFKYSPPPQNHDILTVGLHTKRKGFDYLINTMPNILKEFPDAKLHITSEGPQTSNLKYLTKKLGLDKSIIFHGRVSDEKLFELYRQCKVFCHPSLSEGFCHTTLEAMATGRPVVSTNTIGSEMVENGKTGLLAPTADSHAIADAILKIFSDDDLTYKMGVRARKKVEEEYDWNVIAKKYYEVYQEVV